MRMTVLITMLLGGVAWIIASKNSSFFKDFSKTREESAELLEVKTHAAQINTLMEIFTEKVRLYGMDLVAESSRDQFSPVFMSKFSSDTDLLMLEVIRKDLDIHKQVGRIVKEDFTKEGAKPPVWDHEKINRAFEGTLIVEKYKYDQVLNENDAYMLTIFYPLVKESETSFSHIAVASVRMEKLRRTFAEIISRDVYLTDSNGSLLAHSKGDLVKEFDAITDWALFQKAKSSTLMISQITENLKGYNDVDIQGAFSKTPYGLIVFSETPKAFILGPSKIAKQESIYWLGIILSASFFLVFVFSTTITNPIEKLQKLTEEVAAGNFDVYATQEITSNDEVGDLAVAFDNMTEGLRERDKIKNVMNKFHGSSVADTLMSSELEKTGSRKDCVIYFSDIRGFTDFSERHEAEEVVEMLNEYFEIMVGIIIKNGGVVDKFIGDAIMAVWGAPTGQEDDAQRAMKACLEMRQGLVEFNNKRIAQGKEPMRVGMGLHIGSVISGTIGSSERMEYTVIGDNVNMAARIEASTKAFGADVLLSNDIAQVVQNDFIIKEAGRVEVKGKAEKLILHTLHGYRHADGTVEIVETPYSSYKAEKADKVKVG
jgi:adenylate cyclase